MQTIEFSVRYTLDEYLSFVAEHALVVINEQRAAKGKAPLAFLTWWTRSMIWALATPAFLYKRHKVGECRFTIDAQQVARTAKGGAMSVPWSEVVAVHRYSQGWLVAKANGAMPLPLRCMTPLQIAEFSQFLQSRPQPPSAAQ